MNFWFSWHLLIMKNSITKIIFWKLKRYDTRILHDWNIFTSLLNAFLWLHQIILFLLNLTRIHSRFRPWQIHPWSSWMWLQSRTSSQPSFLHWTSRTAAKMIRIKDPWNPRIWKTFLPTVCIFLQYSIKTLTQTLLMITKLVIWFSILLTFLLSSLYFMLLRYFTIKALNL